MPCSLKQIKDKFKASIKKAYAENRRKAHEQRAFNQILQKKLETARRQVVAKETIHQVKLQAKRRVKAVYTPKKPTQQLKEDILKGLPA